MKRTVGVLVALVVLAFVACWVMAADKPAEKTFTLTESQLKAKVEEGMAAAAIADATTMGERVRDPKYWTTVVYPVDGQNGAQFIVYTGPGAATFTHWVKLAPPKTTAKPEKK